MVLFPKQFEAWDFKTQFGAAVAGVQSGKTHLGAYWSGKKLNEFPKGNGIIVAPTYKILQQATLKKLFEIYPTYRQGFKEQKGEINFRDGATIFVRSADSPLGIEGITANWIWLDEGGMTSQLTWTVLRSRVSLTGGQILITTTPYNMGWLYKDFFVRWKNKEDVNFAFFTWPSIANPLFPKDFYEAEKKRLLPEEFARRYDGEFRKMIGLVWDLPESQEIAPIDNLKVKAEMRIMGVDWGFRNPAAISVLYLYDKQWYIVDEWKQAERTTVEIIQVILNKLKEHKVTKIFCDSAEPDRIEEARRAGLPVFESNKDVEGGISFIKQLIYQKGFFVYNTCIETLDEMSMYHYLESVTENKEQKELPEKFNDHLMDAMRYALYSYQGQKIVFGIASEPLKPYYGDIDVKL